MRKKITTNPNKKINLKKMKKNLLDQFIIYQ